MVQPTSQTGNTEPLTPVATPQPSFVNVLQQLEDNSRITAVIEGGVDAWARPDPPKLDPTSDKIIFQQIDIEDYQEIYNVTSLRMFGVTSSGHSVLANVTGFRPYFYTAFSQDLRESDLSSLRKALNKALRKPVVVGVEIVMKHSSLNRRRTPFVKVTVRNQHELAEVQDKCCYVDGFEFGVHRLKRVTYETNIPFVLRFMVDTKTVGMSWIEVPAGAYNLISDKKSHCQIEISMRWDAFRSHMPRGQWSAVAPLRILSFDIECVVREGTFPEANQDSVLQIANMVTRQGESTPFVRNVFTLNTCAGIVGTQVFEYMDELEMLMGWCKFVEEVDPDVIIGYNIAQFDIPYLLDRARALNGIDFPYLGRLKAVQAQTEDTKYYASAFSRHDTKSTCLNGRLQFDLYQVVWREHQLRPRSLNAASKHFLGDQKEDVNFSQIMGLQNGNAETRSRLAIYCLKDTYLPQRLLDKLSFFPQYTGIARTTGVPFSYILSRGGPMQALAQRYRTAHDNNDIVATIGRSITV